jgi:hypothetical protein
VTGYTKKKDTEVMLKHKCPVIPSLYPVIFLILAAAFASVASTAAQSSSATTFVFPSPLLSPFLPISLQALEVNWNSHKNTELTGPGQRIYSINLALPYIQGYVGNIIDHCNFTTIAGRLAGGQMFDTDRHNVILRGGQGLATDCAYGPWKK